MTKGLTPFGDTSMETFKGKELDILSPSPEAIDIYDIATALGNSCRFNGHVNRFYSVAEHSVLVSDLLSHMGRPDLSAAGLLHDASEAYMGDMISPVKKIAGQDLYKHTTAEIDKVIGKKFRVQNDLFDHSAVKTADLWALKIEAHQLVSSRGRGWYWPEVVAQLDEICPPEIEWEGGLSPFRAASLFLFRWEQLSRG